MCPNSGCIIADLISWLITNNFMIGFISGLLSSLVATWLLKKRKRALLKKHWKGITGTYSVYSLKNQKMIEDQFIKIIKTDNPLIFNVTSTGGNGNWKGELKVEEDRAVGIGSFRYEGKDNLFGMHNYNFDLKRKTISMGGLNHGDGTKNLFSFILTQIDDKTIMPE